MRIPAETINKKMIADELAEKLDMRKDDAFMILESIVGIIQSHAANGEQVVIRGLMSIYPISGRNVCNGLSKEKTMTTTEPKLKCKVSRELIEWYRINLKKKQTQ